MILADMHSHTHHSGDCKIPPKEMIESALKKGLKYYAITDHHDIDFPFTSVSFLLEPNAYLNNLEKLSSEIPSDFTLIKGIELGMQPHIKDEIDTIAANHPFDFIIGSSHLAKGKDPYLAEFYDGFTRNEGYRNYFEATYEWLQAIDSFDTLGHLDYVIRYWRGDDQRKYKLEDFSDIIDGILTTLIKKDKALEVNSSGYLQKLDEPNPSYQVLQRYFDLGGELLTIGSDAHLPQNVAHSFDIIEDQLKRIGYRSYTIYIDRKPIQIGFD